MALYSAWLLSSFYNSHSMVYMHLLMFTVVNVLSNVDKSNVGQTKISLDTLILFEISKDSVYIKFHRFTN